MGFIGVYVPLYAAQGVLIPFFGIWLLQKGVPKGVVSVLLSSLFLCKVISNPLAAHLSDLTNQTARIAAVLAGCVVACYAVLMFSVPVWAVCALAVLASFCTGPLFPLTDRLALAAGRRFGWKRVWGSVGFAGGTVLAGLIAKKHADALMLTVVAGTALACAALCALGREPIVTGRTAVSPTRDLLGLPWKAQAIIVAAAFTQSSNGYLYTMAGVHWTSLGFSQQSISTLWVAGIASEISAFILIPLALSRVRSEFVIAMAGGVTAIRWSVLGAATSFPGILAAQLLQAATIGANAAALGAFVATRLPEHVRAGAMSAYMTLSMGILIVIATAFAQLVERSMNVNGFYAMVPFALCSCALAIAASQRNPSTVIRVKEAA